MVGHSGPQECVPLKDGRQEMTHSVHIIAQMIIDAFTYRSEIVVCILTGCERFVWGMPRRGTASRLVVWMRAIHGLQYGV